jgi:hypothetical protein
MMTSPGAKAVLLPIVTVAAVPAAAQAKVPKEVPFFLAM